MSSHVKDRESIAVVGAGVAGLTAAHVLASRHDVTVYEAEPRLGGHAHTHDVRAPDGSVVAVDTGFIVHNDRTYPLLRRLFAELEVAVSPTEMSMSIRHEETGVEYAGGRGAIGFLARPRQLVRRDYRQLLLGVRRFHRLATKFLATSAEDDLRTYGDFITACGFPRAFIELYAVPLVACVWSTGTDRALDHPARHLFTFLQHHGMLEIGNSPQWLTVEGGSRTYVDALATRLDDVRVATPVRRIMRHEDSVEIVDATGGRATHDRVVVATHSDTALNLLADATPLEKDVLGAIQYSDNETVLHQDLTLLPHTRGVRSSWNYLVPMSSHSSAPIVTYWMNKLQGLPSKVPLLVTLNATDRIDPAKVIASMTYSHPVFDAVSVAAQRRLPSLSGGRTAFAGAYHGWGFHEDGCRSGVAAAEALGVSW